MLKGFDLCGRTAIVTGANTGLGQAIAVALAEAGAGIVAVGRSGMAETKALVAASGRPFHEITADLATLEPIGRIVEEAEAAAKADEAAARRPVRPTIINIPAGNSATRRRGREIRPASPCPA